MSRSRSPFFRAYGYVARWLVLNGNAFAPVPIVVYQMAKVGSSATVEALAAVHPAVFHVHRMHATHLARMRSRRQERGWLVPAIPVHDRIGLKLGEKLMAPGRRSRIVSLVREPIGRNLSAYFEHLDAVWRTPDAHAVVSVEDLARGFVERFTHDEALTWFDDEMLPVLGIDVYQHPFPADGHSTIRAGGRDLLILQCELDDEAKRQALSDFVGKPVPPLRRANATPGKAKGAVYEQFVRTVQLTPAYVDAMLDSRYGRHFYGAATREGLRRLYLRQDPP